MWADKSHREKVLEADNGLEAESDDFDFSAGDEVIVRVLEDGEVVGEFNGECHHFYTRPEAPSDKAVIETPWRTMSKPMFGPNEAEFEVDNAE